MVEDQGRGFFGGILIVIGVFLLLRNLLGLHLGNWWALFLLIPAAGSLASAWKLYQAHGTIDAAVRGPLVGGVVLLFVFAMFFFGFNWSLFWPVLLILAGIGARRRLPGSENNGKCNNSHTARGALQSSSLWSMRCF